MVHGIISLLDCLKITLIRADKAFAEGDMLTVQDAIADALVLLVGIQNNKEDV